MALSVAKKDNKISRLKSRFDAINIKDLLAKVLAENKEYIEDLNIEQLEQGKRADGTEITPKYSPNYAAFKASKGQAPDKVNLRLEGDFHKGITAKVTKQEVTIDNTDWKNEHLSEKYGDAIIGISTESIKKLNEHLIPQLKELILKQLQ